MVARAAKSCLHREPLLRLERWAALRNTAQHCDTGPLAVIILQRGVRVEFGSDLCECGQVHVTSK